MLENNVSGNLVGDYGIGSVLDLDRDVEIVKDPRKERHRSDPVDLYVEQAVYRHIHSAEQCYKNGYITYGDVRIILHHEDAARQIQEHRADAREGREDDPEPASCHALFYVQADHLSVGPLISVIFILFLAEKLYQKLSAYGKSLV